MSGEVFVSVLPDCDLCKARGIVTPASYDAKLDALDGHWGFVCQLHFDIYGPGELGTGLAQRLMVIRND